MADRLALYSPRPLGTKALQRLGARLASRDALSPDEQLLYEAFIGDAKDRVVATQAHLDRLLPLYASVILRLEGADVVGRIKTRSTLADKLERTPQEKLPSIHDVAGIRIVAGFSTTEQRSVVNLLKSEFSDKVDCSREAIVVNRLDTPMHGYRALHLITWPGGRPVEIQVRTQLQHAWAQTMEVLGDRWGREARYGLPVKGGTARQQKERQAVVESMKRLSDLIATYESKSNATAVAHLNLTDEQLLEAGMSVESIQLHREYAEVHGKELDEAASALHTMLRSFSENFGHSST